TVTPAVPWPIGRWRRNCWAGMRSTCRAGNMARGVPYHPCSGIASEHSMAGKKRGLGRGLESLLSNEFDDMQQVERASLQDMALDDLRPGRYQPRRAMDEDALESLAQSIRSQGVVQPLVVRDMGDGYEIVAGERRWRAARLAGLDTVPVVLRDVEDATAMAVALIENIQ